MINPQLRLFRFGPLVPIPRLTKDQHRLSVELEVRSIGGIEGHKGMTRLLRGLLRKRFIEVMTLRPATYRVTRLGRTMRRIGGGTSRAFVLSEPL